MSIIGAISLVIVVTGIISINNRPTPVIQRFDTNALVICEQERRMAAFYATAILRALHTNHVSIEPSTPGMNWMLRILQVSNQTVVSYELDK